MATSTPATSATSTLATSGALPGPRDGLDEGTVADLAQASRAVPVSTTPARPWVASAYGPIDVPDDASGLIEGLAAYGS